MTSNATDTLARQWEMLRLIPRAPRKTTVRDLGAELERRGYRTTARTIARDLQALSGQFALVSDETSKPFGWSWAKDANFEFMPGLSASQGVALLLARVHLRGLLPQPLMKELAPVFDMAEKELAATGWKDWHRRTAIVPTSMPLLVPRVDARVLDDVHSALATRKCLKGKYRSKGSQSAKEMTIHPLGLLVRGAVHYLVCTLRDYKDIRHLALHRLSETAVLNQPSMSPDGFDFAGYVASSAAKYHAQGKIRLVAHFAAGAAEHLRETPVSKDQVLVELQAEEFVELTATVESDETLRWWLLGFGDRVEVREPVKLRDEMREQLTSAVKRYRRPTGVS